MNRKQKTELIESLKSDFDNCQASFLVGYKGLSVAQMQALRRKVRAKGGRLKIAKNRLVKRAIADVKGACELESHLKDQLGVVFASDEFSGVAKVLSDFSKENPALTLMVGCLDSELISKDKISMLASLPSKDVLLAQVCGTFKAPIVGLPRVLNILVLRLLWTLKQIEAKKQ